MRSLGLLVAATVLLSLLGGCVCGKRPRCCPPVGTARAEPALPDGPYARQSGQTAWDYLRAKYDADADGRITAAEYDRGEAAFTRLDKDGDGTITEPDLKPGPVHGLMVRMILVQWFQDDAQPMLLAREELERALEATDADEDGVLDARELDQRMTGHEAHVPQMPTPPPGMEPHLSVRLLVDADEDGVVRHDELLAWFDARAKDGAWAPMGQRRPPPGGRAPGGRAPGRRGPVGAAEGEAAPDFTLASPDGAKTVRLASFRGEKPVALIFGSYT